jgi:hypothetical protein
MCFFTAIDQHNLPTPNLHQNLFQNWSQFKISPRHSCQLDGQSDHNLDYQKFFKMNIISYQKKLLLDLFIRRHRNSVKKIFFFKIRSILIYSNWYIRPRKKIIYCHGKIVLIHFLNNSSAHNFLILSINSYCINFKVWIQYGLTPKNHPFRSSQLGMFELAWPV